MPSFTRPDYISALGFQPEVAAKLRSLGAETAAHLLAQIEAAPGAFESYLGHQSMRRVLESLRSIVPKSEQVGRISPPGYLGAMTGESPQLSKDAPFDLEERERLYKSVKELKARNAPEAQIADAERELEKFFERTNSMAR